MRPRTSFSGASLRQLVPLLAALLVALVSVSCNKGTLARPSVTFCAIDSGGTLRLRWSAVTDAEWYTITTDDSVYTTTDTSWDVASPSVTIEVRAVDGDKESAPATVKARIVETSNVRVFGISDTDTTHHHALGFDADGKATTYSLASGNMSKWDFIVDDADFPSEVHLVSPGEWSPKGNSVMNAATTAYDDAVLAAAPGTGYATHCALATGNVYFMWLDPANDGWSMDDHYAKAKVISISGPLVTMQIGYQKVGGLRWLK
jgi:hypothetical protein